jgi:energy-coupling factor transporter ATP-binding protein EcfA2
VGETVLTKRSNPAEAAIDDLHTGKPLKSGKVKVGPIGPHTRRLLTVLWNERVALAAKTGAEQGRHARRSYLGVASSPAGDASGALSGDVPADSPSDPTSPRSWRLHRLRTMSFRGIAPLGEPFEHQFAGAPTLIYGTNGSGKSSLLSAVVWVLAGEVVTDAGEAAGSIAVYARKKASADPTKVGTWPSVHTLPRLQDPTKVPQDCWVEIHLRTPCEKHDLFLRRDLAGLQESADGETWQTCESLETHGIGPLDLQLSLSAAAMFSHESLGGATGAHQLLSMILGFEELDDLSKLVSGLSGNITRIITDETKQADARRANVRARLTSQLRGLRDDHPLRTSLNDLANDLVLSAASVAVLAARATELLQSANSQLASVIGLGDSGSAPVGLADALVAAISQLEKPWPARFREAESLRLDELLSLRGAESVDDLIDGLTADFERILTGAGSRIDSRLSLWRDELAPASRKSLLLQAVDHYDGHGSPCPVCQQPIDGLPVAHELTTLADIPRELRQPPGAFFHALREELAAAFPEAIAAFGTKEPSTLLRRDWTSFAAHCAPVLRPVIARWTDAVGEVLDTLPPVALVDRELLPTDVDPQFRNAARGFLDYVGRVHRSIATMRWARSHLAATRATLERLLTGVEGPTPSLLSTLGFGRKAAEDIRPTEALCGELVVIRGECEEAAELDRGIQVVVEMSDALEDLKPIGAYAGEVVLRVFGDIEASTLANFEKIYYSPNESLKPTRLQVSGKVKDRSIEALLGGGTYEVPSQHVSNAGQLRALALAFYFALLDKHPAGLGFVIMDDPILSLDEDNRRWWSNRLLQPALDTTQFVVSTHQLDYLNICRTDFHAGRVLEINHRRHDSALTMWDGGRLERAEDLLRGPWKNAANEMRKYREDVLIALDSYSPVAFFTTKKLEHSLDRYAALDSSHVLAHSNRDFIVRTLMGPNVKTVLDAGSHAYTEARVGMSAAEECLSALKVMDATFRNEIKRLNLLRRDTRTHAASPSVPPSAIDPRPSAPVIPIQHGFRSCSARNPVGIV